MNLLGDFWNQNRNDAYSDNDVSFEIATQYMKMLDGDKKTEILLENDNGSLSIAGGNNGLFIVNYYDLVGNFYLLTRDSNETGEIKLVCGGQSAFFDIKNCFQIKFVLDVVRDYFKDEKILEKYKWSY